MSKRLSLLPLLACLWPGSGWAHELDVAYLEVRAEEGRVTEELTLSAPALGSLVTIDADGDGLLTQRDLDARLDAIFSATLGAGALELGGRPCPLSPSEARLEGSSVRVRAEAACPGAGGKLVQRLGFLDAMPRGFRVLGHAIAFGAQRELVADRDAEAVVLTGDPSRGFASFVELGIEHIFTGYDHLAFLLGLLLLGGSLKRLFGMVTSFTLAHSVTLALAALNVVGLPSRFVESAIALSIVYVAAEDFLGLRNNRRWLIAFVFGLVHGFGFASALSGMRLDRAGMAAALFGFNLGVEIGQAILVATLAPLLSMALRRPALSRYLVPGVSFALLCAGAFWFVQRAVL